MTAEIILAPTPLEIDTMCSLRDRGWSLSTVSTRRRILTVATKSTPILRNVVRLPRGSITASYFAFADKLKGDK